MRELCLKRIFGACAVQVLCSIVVEMNSGALRPLLNFHNSKSNISITWSRSFYYKFKRTKAPPLAQPKESPYIVGPYLKPDYVPVEYITEPIKFKFQDDFDHMIYEPIWTQANEERKVRLYLTDDVEGLGIAGQVVDAPYRFGASKLIAMRKAEYYNDVVQKWLKVAPKSSQSASSALSPRTARLLRTQIFPLPVCSTTVVQPWHISLALRLSGCHCPLEAIDENSIENYSDENNVPHVKCTVVINNHEKVEVKFAFAKQKQELPKDDDSNDS